LNEARTRRPPTVASLLPGVKERAVSNGTIRSSVGAPGGLSCRPSETGIRTAAFAMETGPAWAAPATVAEGVVASRRPRHRLSSPGHCASRRERVGRPSTRCLSASPDTGQLFGIVRARAPGDWFVVPAGTLVATF